MALTDYTTYAEIRAVLGVDDKELEDATLALDIYAYGVVSDLKDIAAALPAAFAVVKVIAEGSRSEAQQALYEAVKFFVPYAAGQQLASGLPLFAPKTITDGKASITRDSNSAYKESIAQCRALYGVARQRLESRYAEYLGGSSSSVTRLYFNVVSPSIDPVTGL